METICCDVESEAVRKLILKVAKEGGYDTSTYDHGLIPSRYVRIEGSLLTGNSSCKIGREVSFNEFMRAVSTPCVKPITVAGNAVAFAKDAITIGCTTIDAETVEAIYKRFKEQQ